VSIDKNVMHYMLYVFSFIRTKCYHKWSYLWLKPSQHQYKNANLEGTHTTKTQTHLSSFKHLHKKTI